MDKANRYEYDKILQIKALFEANESLCAQNIGAFSLTGVFTGFVRALKYFCAGAAVLYGFSSLALSADLLWLAGEIFMLLTLFALITAEEALQAFESRYGFLLPYEVKLYKSYKEVFGDLKKLSFPPDYMCSGFAEAVLNELKKGTELSSAYEKCKCLDFDLCLDESAEFIRANRSLIQRAVEFEGIS